MNNKKEKLNIISLHKKVALGLSIITMLGQPTYAFAAENKSFGNLVNQANIFNITQENTNVKKAIYKVPVRFLSKSNGGPLKMAGDTIVNEAVLEVNGNTKKLTITLIPSSQEGLTKDSYITSLTKSENDSTPIGEAIMTTAPDGKQRPGQYIIDVSDSDIESIIKISAGLSAKGMPFTVGVYIEMNFESKTLIQNSQEETQPKPDKEQLKKLVEEIGKMDLSKYTDETKEALLSVLDKAKVVLNHEEALEIDIQNAMKELTEAKENLKKKESSENVDKSKLKAAISKASQLQINNYTEESAKVFKEALNNANKINKDDSAKEADVKSAIEKLELAMNNLKKKVNKVDLGNLIAECNRIKEDDFEYDFNMRVFKNALSDAKDVYNSSNSTQDQVDNALRNLSKAKSNLVAKKKGHILYEVPVSVQKPSGGESMANKVINPIATVEENNGIFTYTVQFGKLTIGDKTAGVDSLYIYDGGSKFAASRGANGTFSWTSNSKVSSQRVSFKVSVMPSDQDAILMFSWAGARETKNDSGKYFVGEAPSKKIELAKKADENKKIEEKKNIENKLNNPKQFRDTNGHWAKVAIDYVVNKGYFYGTSETSFSPNKPITRGQFVTVLGRMLNVNTSIYKSQNFNDVKSSMYYSSYIAWANKMGIVSGVGQGRFAPDKELTREEMAVIMSKFLKVSNKNLNAKGNSNGFKDDGKIKSWAKDAVSEMARLGVVSGMSDGKFAPKSPFTRAQVAQVLFNIDHN